MDWPYRRFLKAYDAFQRRRLCDLWEGRRTAHIAALYANPGFGGEGSSDSLQQVERWYDEVIATIWNGQNSEQKQVEDEAWESPFMNAGRRSMAAIQLPLMPGEKQIQALPAS